MRNKKYINTLDLIETTQTNRKQILEYINKAKSDIFNSFNTPSVLKAYILFRGRTLDDLLLKHSTIQRSIRKDYKQIIRKIHVRDCNILVDKLVWEDQKILCRKINKIVTDKGHLSSSDISRMFNNPDTRGIVIIRYINEGKILLEQDRKNGLIVMKIENINE